MFVIRKCEISARHFLSCLRIESRRKKRAEARRWDGGKPGKSCAVCTTFAPIARFRHCRQDSRHLTNVFETENSRDAGSRSRTFLYRKSPICIRRPAGSYAPSYDAAKILPIRPVIAGRTKRERRRSFGIRLTSEIAGGDCT